MLHKIRKKLSYSLVLSSWNGLYRYFFGVRRKDFGFIAKDAYIRFPARVKGAENIYLYDRCHIMGNSLLTAVKGKFIMKKHSGAAEGLCVITSTHPTFISEWFMDKGSNNDYIEYRDIIVEEDVWIATNVTLLMGAHIGRGAIIGAGAVVRSNIPPYAIAIGNPAKIVGFKFTPEEVIKHEEVLYPVEERLPFEMLESNYNKYFINRLKEIKNYTKI